MEPSIWVNGRMVKNMVKEHSLMEGEKYSGEWKDGKKYGQGTFYYTDGSVYVGEFKDGIPSGQGTGFQLTERSTLGNGIMERKMVKVHSITLMEVFM